jgi:hypothetical protein
MSAVKATKRIKNLSFDHNGAHLALVSKEINSGPANLQDYALVLKGMNGFDEELIEKASKVTVTLPIEEYLRVFFGLWYEDAEILARAMGYTTEDMEEDESEESYSYKDWIDSKVQSISIMKSLNESTDKVETLKGISAVEYLQFLQDQEKIEKAFEQVESLKKESSSNKGLDAQQNSKVESKVGPSGSLKKQKGKTMTKQVNEEMIEKSILDAKEAELQSIVKAKNELEELVKQFKQEKQEAIEKARKDTLGAFVKDAEDLGNLFKGANGLSDSDFQSFVKSIEKLVKLADSSDLFKSVGASGTVEDDTNDGVSDVKKAFAKIKAKSK